MPRFRNVYQQETDFLRGYATVLWAEREQSFSSDGLGVDLKNNITTKRLGNWKVGMLMMGETIPKATNYLALDKQQLDPFGMPKLKISIDYDDNDEKMIKDFFEQSEAMFSSAGFRNFKTSDSHQAPGLDIHEMGGVRMGKDPQTSLLNAWNQLHACKNVFVTDGACMTSTSTQNPSLTYMALAARAADFAVKELKTGRL